MYSGIRRVLRFLGSTRENTIFAFLTLISRSIVLGARLLPSEGFARKAIYIVPIDKVNQLCPKYLLSLSAVRWRLDVTGLRDAGIKMASDVRSLNRGNLVISEAWTSDFEHGFVDPRVEATPEDYRYVTHETVRLMFSESAPWRSTPEYALFAREIKDGRKPYGLENFAELEKRGEDLAGLWDSMNNEGYKTSDETGGVLGRSPFLPQFFWPDLCR